MTTTLENDLDLLDDPESVDCDGCGSTGVGEPFTSTSVYFKCKYCGLSYVATKES